MWIQLVAGCHFYFNCSLDSLVSICASKTNGLNPNRTWKQLTLPLSRILINNSLYCLPYNSYDVSSDNLVLDQLMIPFFRLVTSVRQRKNSESPWGIEPQTFRFHALMLYFATNILVCTSTKRETVKKRFSIYTPKNNIKCFILNSITHDLIIMQIQYISFHFHIDVALCWKFLWIKWRI